MSTRAQLLCMWCGPVAIFFFLVGFWPIAGLVPPPSPDDSAKEIQALYQDDTDALRLGLLVTMCAGALTGPFIAAVSAQMKRVEGRFPVLAYAQLGLGMVGIFVIVLPMMAMQAAAFRPERDADLILAINDLAWLPLVGIIPLFILQCFVIAACVFDDSDEHVFPRWVAYFNIWAGLLLVPASLIYFFKTGPFAWDGVFVFWIGLSVIAIWFVVMSVVVRRAVLGQAAEEAASEPAVAVPA